MYDKEGQTDQRYGITSTPCPVPQGNWILESWFQ